jgi:hypothetical protein
MSAVDKMIDLDPRGALVFAVIGASRAAQGVCSGTLFVILQVGSIVRKCGVFCSI